MSDSRTPQQSSCSINQRRVADGESYADLAPPRHARASRRFMTLAQAMTTMSAPRTPISRPKAALAANLGKFR
jgi:hypothetical protein